MIRKSESRTESRSDRREERSEEDDEGEEAERRMRTEKDELVLLWLRIKFLMEINSLGLKGRSVSEIQLGLQRSIHKHSHPPAELIDLIVLYSR